MPADPEEPDNSASPAMVVEQAKGLARSGAATAGYARTFYSDRNDCDEILKPGEVCRIAGVHAGAMRVGGGSDQ